MRAIRCQIHLKRYFHVSCFHYESDVKQGFDASRIAEKCKLSKGSTVSVIQATHFNDITAL